MRRLLILTAALVASLFLATPAYAAPHYGNQLVAVPALDSLTVAGDILGLGSQDSIDMVLTAVSDCGGPGTAEALFAVDAGKAHYYVTLIAPCLVPSFTDVVITEAVSGVSTPIPGVYQWHA